MGAPRKSPTQKKAARDKKKRTRVVVISTPAPTPIEKKSWTRDQKINVAGVVITVVVAVLGIGIAVATPEIRKKIGLDHDASPENVKPLPGPVPPLKPKLETDESKPKIPARDPQTPKKPKHASSQYPTPANRHS